MTQLESLQEVFKNRLFRIPYYKRGYDWTTVQLKDFWDDLVNLPADREHYTGMLTLKKVDNQIWKGWNNEKWLIEDRACKPLYIVDGQQRLTTLVIFVRSLTELVRSLPEFEGKEANEIVLASYTLASVAEEYLAVEKPGAGIIRTHKFGYETDNPSFLFLRHNILGEPGAGTIEETFYTLNLENAKNFFDENLQKVYDTEGLEGIESLFRKATHNLKFNLYEIGDDFDVFVAFETMNNRGKKLSNLELLKNRLIYLTTLYRDEELPADDRSRLRENINDAWKEVYHQLGRNKEKPLNDDDFLNAHWIMHFQYTRQKGNEYIKFLLQDHFTPQNVFLQTDVSLSTVKEFHEVHEVDEEPDEPEDEEQIAEVTVKRSKIPPGEINRYVNSLKSASLYWYLSHNPHNADELTEDEKLWIDRLNRVGIGYFRPLVTASFMAPGVMASDRVELFKNIERFIFIVFRMGRAQSNYRNSEFFRLTREMLNGNTTVKSIVELLETRMEYSFYWDEAEENRYFEFEFFKPYLKRKFDSGIGFYGWNGLRYFLYEYEMEKVRERGSPKIDWELFAKGSKDAISIEHILPQTPTAECWQDVTKGFNSKEIKFLQGSLGNLVPLSRSINSSLQNDCFEDKKKPKHSADGKKLRQGYNDGSHSEIEIAGYEQWDASAILKRGMDMLRFMERRWEIKFENEEYMRDLLFLNFLD